MTRTRLRRRTEQRLVAGVASGIADRLNASVGFVRVLTCLACVWTPPLLAVYAGAALLIPPRGSDRPDWDNLIAAGRLGLVFGVPAVVFAGGFDIGEPFVGPLGWWIAFLGLLAAGAWALLSADYRRNRPRTREEARAVVLAAVPACACLVALAGALLLAPEIRWERFVPLAAVLGGVTLLLASRRGHLGAWLAPALLSLAAAALVAAADVRLQGGVGSRHVTPQAPAGEPVVARQAVGDLTVDLREVTRGGRAATVEASVGIGTLRVIVPYGTPVGLDARVGRGQIEAAEYVDPPVQGIDARVHRRLGRQRHSRPTAAIRLTARVGLGLIELDRDAGGGS